MGKVRIGDQFKTYSYKHDGTILRTSDEVLVLDVTDDYIVVGSKNARVLKSGGRFFKTKEPSIMYFYKNNWFNVIGQLKEKGLYYYCNLASPYIIEDDAIKYIDYDLDLRVYPDYKYKVLDRNEYEYHRNLMGYPDTIHEIVHDELKVLIEMLKERKGPFAENVIVDYYNKYKQMIEINN